MMLASLISMLLVSKEVYLTWYNDVGIMANGKQTHQGATACARDIPFGTQFILNNKTYTCEDRYNKRLDKIRKLPTVDVWSPLPDKDLLILGKKKVKIKFIFYDKTSQG